MARIGRIVAPGIPHHVTQRGVRKQTTFFDDDDFEAYLRIASALKDDSDLEIWAYCLMPNHIHMVVVPRSSDSLARFFGRVHSRYARRTNKRHGWNGHLWQERFYSAPMDETHAIAAMRYVELNPVRASLCESPLEWRWSSARGNLDPAKDSLLDTKTSKELVPLWSEYLHGYSDAHVVDDIRNKTQIGRPMGSERFVQKVEQMTGRILLKRRKAS